MIYRSSSSAETKKLAAEMARNILRQGPGRRAIILALQGELGAGKTTFTQGFFRGLGLKRIPASPTFIFMRRTAFRKNGFKNIFHVDAYRAKRAEDLTLLGLPGIFKNPENIVLVEWPEKLGKLMSRRAAKLLLEHGLNAEERIIRFEF